MARPLLVYAHIPFCVAKCHFCDWVQQIPTASLRQLSGSPIRQAYLDAMCQQLHHQGPLLREAGYVPRILYWGGGTASILEIPEIRRLFAALREEFDLSQLDEATIECSPETLSLEKLRVFHEEGFRRVSIGVQSFQDERLRQIGRAHSARQALEAVELARQAGFLDINIDLIVGFAGESREELEASVRSGIGCGANHVSLYPYRPTHGTVMFRQLRSGTAGPASLEGQSEAYARSRDLLCEAGLEEYAMSHFGSPRCRSDLAYFQLHMDWVGFGSGATSLLGGRYLANERAQLSRFISQPCQFDEDIPAASSSITPRLLHQSLSTWEGASAALWKERTGEPLDSILQQEPVRAMLEFFSRVTPVIRDEQGVRLRREDVAQAIIQLQSMRIPRRARGDAKVRALLG